jgi:hypothetical protein
MIPESFFRQVCSVGEQTLGFRHSSRFCSVDRIWGTHLRVNFLKPSSRRRMLLMGARSTEKCPVIHFLLGR